LRRNLVAYVALFVALSSTGYAASSRLLPRNSVGSPQVINGSLQKADLSARAIAALHGARGPRGFTGARGAQGATGATGAQGAQGPTGPAGPAGPAGPSTEQQLLQAQGLVAESFDRALAAWPARPHSGQLHVVGVPLLKGQVVSSLTVGIASGGTGVTHGWLVLYSPTGALLARSDDSSSSFEAPVGNPLLTLPMQTPYTVTGSGLYYVGFLTDASTTEPTFVGSAFPVAGFEESISGNQVRSGQQSDLESATEPPDPAAISDGVSTWMPWIGVS
jgi:hypothetical protein